MTTMADTERLDVAIIGGGFGGIAMAHHLAKRRGLRFAVLEKGARAGGTWRDNTYPGCACDIPSHLYSLSFAPNPDWSRMFATQPEILDYFDRVVAEQGLDRHIRLGTEVQAATWDADAALWRLTLNEGRMLAARFVVSAMGVLHHAAFPDLPGRDTFAGKTLHTALWDDDYDLTGKRVAVIGTGASAIQLVPAIVDRVALLAVFQRTPPWIVPKFDRPFSDAMRAKLRRQPFYRRYLRFKLFYAHEQRATAFTRQDGKSIGKTEALCRGQLDKQVADPALRAALTPDYVLGCKRLLISSDYFPALQKPNATLVSDPIARIEPDAVVTRNGSRYPVDAIVYGTGYDAQNALRHIDIRGAGGVTLQSAWDAHGMSAYLGTTVSGFPNLFLITGPNSGGGHNSQIFMIEAQAQYIARAIRATDRRGARTIEVAASAQRRFDDDMTRRMADSVWKRGGCQSWFLDKKTGRNTLLWPSYSTHFWWLTRRLKKRDYRWENSGAEADPV